MKTRLILLLAAVCIAFTATAQQQKTDGQIPSQGTYVRIDKSTQNFRLYQDGKLKVDSVCGTGQGFTKANTTTSGRHHVLEGGGVDYYSKKYGASMPYARQITPDGIFLHGSKSFVTLKGRGMPQSHGCVRLPVSVAKEVYGYLKVGDPIDIVGDELESLENLGIAGLFEDLGDGGIRMKIAGPNPSKQDIKFARDMWVQKQLFFVPRGEKDKSKVLVGYPCMPKDTHVRLLDFERMICKPGERLTLDH